MVLDDLGKTEPTGLDLLGLERSRMWSLAEFRSYIWSYRVEKGQHYVVFLHFVCFVLELMGTKYSEVFLFWVLSQLSVVFVAETEYLIPKVKGGEVNFDLEFVQVSIYSWLAPRQNGMAWGNGSGETVPGEAGGRQWAAAASLLSFFSLPFIFHPYYKLIDWFHLHPGWAAIIHIDL